LLASFFELVKDQYGRGFRIVEMIAEKNRITSTTRGQRKKYLAALRRLLGMSKKEFSKFMGWLGGYWSLF